MLFNLRNMQHAVLSKRLFVYPLDLLFSIKICFSQVRSSQILLFLETRDRTQSTRVPSKKIAVARPTNILAFTILTHWMPLQPVLLSSLKYIGTRVKSALLKVSFLQNKAVIERINIQRIKPYFTWLNQSSKLNCLTRKGRVLYSQDRTPVHQHWDYFPLPKHTIT